MVAGIAPAMVLGVISQRSAAASLLTIFGISGAALLNVVRNVNKPTAEENGRIVLYSEFSGRPIARFTIYTEYITIKRLDWAGIITEHIPVRSIESVESVRVVLSRGIRIYAKQNGDIIKRTLVSRRPSRVMDVLKYAIADSERIATRGQSTAETGGHE